jgi:glycosyltransferase involved in cell wall biosynthesis
MKVLHVNEHLAYKGGVETYLFGLLPYLEERDVSSVVAYAEGDPALYGRTRHAPAIGTAGFWAEVQARSQMKSILREESPDLVHIHNVHNVGVLQASFDYGPTIVTTHDYRWVCPANSFFYKRTQEVCDRTCGLGCFATTVTKHCVTPRPQYAAYFYRRARWSIEHAERFAQVIAPSEGARAKYAASGFDGASMTVLPYFCELDPANAPRAIPDPPTITYLGRVAPNKGHEYFVEALGHLSDEVRGVMVGGIPDEAARTLRDQAERAGCADRLELLGWASRDEVLELFDRTSVFVFPSLWPETLGIVGIEALSRGVPVVASDVGGVREWLEDGENGFVVSPKDAQAIAASVRRLLGNEERLLAFGRRGINTVRERFLPAPHVDQLISLYESSIASHSVTSTVHVE